MKVTLHFVYKCQVAASGLAPELQVEKCLTMSAVRLKFLYRLCAPSLQSDIPHIVSKEQKQLWLAAVPKIIRLSQCQYTRTNVSRTELHVF
jgi:hypothetical protein